MALEETPPFVKKNPNYYSLRKPNFPNGNVVLSVKD